jgi:hypothetical protein
MMANPTDAAWIHEPDLKVTSCDSARRCLGLSRLPGARSLHAVHELYAATNGLSMLWFGPNAMTDKVFLPKRLALFD